VADRTRLNNDPFYVGYLPMPPAIRRFIVPWLAGNLVLALCIAAAIASNHREPGGGVWDTTELVQFTGELVVEPYPLLRTESQGTYLLVEQGKFGVQSRIKSLNFDTPAYVSVAGYRIERDGRKVIEVDSSVEQPVTTIQFIRPLVFPERMDLGAHTLRGEIVDPKCYLGVMQPGEGKTHKVCATLCISGGIPPMFLVRDVAGNTAAYLLTDAEGKAIPDSIYPYIADPVELTGRVLRDGDLLILQADLGSIRRLGAGE